MNHLFCVSDQNDHTRGHAEDGEVDSCTVERDGWEGLDALRFSPRFVLRGKAKYAHEKSAAGDSRQDE